MSEQKKFRCIVCDGTEWENVDEFRLKPSGMHMCKKCGFISYPDRYKTEAEAKEYYKKDYRNCPNAAVLFSSQKKIQYHLYFLNDLFKKWTEEKRQIVFCDIGTAIGMLPKLIKDNFPGAQVYGTEWATNFKKHCFHEYGIKLDDDFDQTKKYDMISNYKVSEHQCDFDLELKKYAACLKDDGFIYLSTQTWFHTMNNDSLGSWDQKDMVGIEYYYHPDHINVWSRKHLQHIIKKAGLVIEKQDFFVYGDTYLLRKPRQGEVVCASTDVVPESPNEIKYLLEKIHKASNLYIEGKFKDALEVFPNFPRAWMINYEMNRKQLHELGFEKIEEDYLSKAISACSNVSEIYAFAADVAMRYDKFEKAIAYLDRALNMKPNAPLYLKSLSHCFRQMAMREQDLNKKYRFYQDARNVMRFIMSISSEHTTECLSWIMQDHACIPIPENAPVEIPPRIPEAQIV